MKSSSKAYESDLQPEGSVFVARAYCGKPENTGFDAI